jgi:hypothetical protein
MSADRGFDSYEYWQVASHTGVTPFGCCEPPRQSPVRKTLSEGNYEIYPSVQSGRCSRTGTGGAVSRAQAVFDELKPHPMQKNSQNMRISYLTK